ncbi:Protein MAIN-LIKE 2 [Glycine max]|nr:Protein MAIN-LIKE 2 [Glycine max]
MESSMFLWKQHKHRPTHIHNMHFKIDHYFVTKLIGRWRPETHIFQLLVGECTITLDDVAFQLGLRVDGKQMTGLTYVDCEDMCRTYLGVIPQKCDAIVYIIVIVLGIISYFIVAPYCKRQPTYPIVLRWSGGGSHFVGTPRTVVISFRTRIDNMRHNQV